MRVKSARIDMEVLGLRLPQRHHRRALGEERVTDPHDVLDALAHQTLRRDVELVASDAACAVGPDDRAEIAVLAALVVDDVGHLIGIDRLAGAAARVALLVNDETRTGFGQRLGRLRRVAHS